MADELTAADAGAAVAPELERLRSSIARSAPALLQDLAERSGLGPLLPVFAMLRNLPGRTVPLSGVRDVFVYQAVDVDSVVGSLAGAGLVVLDGDHLGLTGAGDDLVAEMHRRLGRFADELWSEHGDDLDALQPLVARVLAAASATGGPAFAVVAPVWEPPGTSSATLLAERLTPLRFHRFDAHLAAWRAAGLSIAEIQALEPGPRRAAIEAETDRLGAPPYEILSASERAGLLAGLRRLPSAPPGGTTPS